MMEKYATELGNITATAEQVKTIRELCSRKDIEFHMPKSFKEAEEIIMKLEMKEYEGK